MNVITSAYLDENYSMGVPAVFLLRLDNALIRDIARAKAALQLSGFGSTADIKIPLRPDALSMYDRLAGTEQDTRDETGKKLDAAWLVDHDIDTLLADQAKPWLDMGTAGDGNASKFDVSSHWMLIDNTRLAIELWDEHSEALLKSGEVAFKDVPGLAKQLDVQVAQVLASWGIPAAAEPEAATPRRRAAAR